MSQPNGHHSDPLARQHTNDIELGVTDVLQRHITRHVVPPKPVSERKLNFEHKRPRILREMMAEATGVFFYVFAGISSVASFTLATTNPVGAAVGIPVFGSLFQIGWAFAFGIAFAIITCASTSGGHFNPAITSKQYSSAVDFEKLTGLPSLLRNLARISMEESAPLHFLSDFWSVLGWNDVDGVLLAPDPSSKGNRHTRARHSRVQRWRSQYPMPFPQPGPNQPGVPVLPRVLR
jgi:hypothetical protein